MKMKCNVLILYIWIKTWREHAVDPGVSHKHSVILLTHNDPVDILTSFS